MSDPLQAVRRYYEDNTPIFLALGSSRATPAIHRALWRPGVRTLEEALQQSHARVLAEALALAERDGLREVRAADLGCGVGAGLFYLADSLPAPLRALGLTLSPAQARRAHRLGAGRAVFAEGDFQHVPAASGVFDLVYSIEAFVHAPAPERYLAEAARLLRPGGRLALCDDFRAARALTPAEMAWLAAYQAGWQALNVRARAQVEGLAAAAGLRRLSAEDLTPWLRLRALPEALARALLALGRRLPAGHALLPSMLGSLALQQCLRAGVVEYGFLVFEKPSP